MQRADIKKSSVNGARKLKSVFGISKKLQIFAKCFDNYHSRIRRHTVVRMIYNTAQVGVNPFGLPGTLYRHKKTRF